MNQNSPDPYHPMLKESIDRFITEFRNGVTDFSNFGSIFSRLLQILPDPPLGIVWFKSALTFHTAKFTVQGSSSARVSLVKDLFQLLVSHSSPCGVPKRIAILAPVIYELYHLVLSNKKNVKSLEVEDLLEGLVSYSSICCASATGFEEDEDDALAGSHSCLLDVIRAWMVDKFGVVVGVGNGDEYLKGFFPIVSDEVRKGIRTGFGVGVGNGDEYLKGFFPIVSDEVRKGIRTGFGVGYLAGVVMCEAFLLRLCLKFGSGIPRIELEKDLHNWAVQTINGFRSFCFFDTLLKMLLEPVLPVTSLLSYEDEVLLKEVLYDAVIMVEYSFLKPQRGIQLPGNHLKTIAVTWLVVVDNAIRSARENGNQAKAFSYINAFSEACLPSQLIKWATNQTITGGRKISTPSISTPVALIKWLLNVEEQGVRIFDCNFSKLHAKAVICKSRVEYVLPVIKPEEKNLDGNHLFSSAEEVREEDKFDGDLEMADSMDIALLAADGMMKATATDGTRKRKEGMIKDEREVKVKFVKCHFHESSVREKILPIGNDDGLSSGSEVDNSFSEEDMEDIKQ